MLRSEALQAEFPRFNTNLQIRQSVTRLGGLTD